MEHETIINRQNAEKKLLLDQLRKTPIIQLACERSGVGRSTYYRWRQEDKEFAKRADEAMEEGDHFINDLTEAQLITLIKEKKFSAMSYWLKHHHPKYRIPRIVMMDESPPGLSDEEKASLLALL